MQIYGWGLLTVCHHPGTSCERRHCNSEDIVLLICHANLWWMPLTESHHFPIGLVQVEL